MQPPTEQPPSPNPEAPPARRRRREQVIVVAEGVFCAALALVGAFLLRGPNVFPSAHGWMRAAFFAAVALPIGLSTADFARNCEPKAEVRP